MSTYKLSETMMNTYFTTEKDQNYAFMSRIRSIIKLIGSQLDTESHKLIGLCNDMNNKPLSAYRQQ